MKYVKGEVFTQLQSDILRLQGFKHLSTSTEHALNPHAEVFPRTNFPTGAVHEFITTQPNEMAATSGFLAGLLVSLMGTSSTAIWISASRTIFPPALKSFGLAPDRFLFIDLQKEKDVQWVMEEALKCGAVTTVIGEMQNLSFTASRRLQLAVEESEMRGFVVRTYYRAKSLSTTACFSRWRITSLPSKAIEDNFPGIGFPAWQVELLRIRHGQTGQWKLHWTKGQFAPIEEYQEATWHRSLLDQKVG